MTLSCFKAYDIRGRLGVDLDAPLARRIGAAFATLVGAKKVVIGRDCRLSSEALADAVAQGLTGQGADVLDLGLCGTEEVYFATDHHRACGGMMITASHNPKEYNGMKLVQAGAAPLDPEHGMARLQALTEAAPPPAARPPGRRHAAPETRAAYVERVLSFVDADALPPVHVLVNAGHGAAGPTFDALARALAVRGARLRITRIHHAPDGRFPEGIPNPLLPENRAATACAVRDAGADLGVAWDGDFDRCFFFDAAGAFVPGEYVVGLLAEAFLAKAPGATIVHDPRVAWNTRAVVARFGGIAHATPTGHAYFKRALRETGAIYGGEMSAHHYFRDFMACDSGMIPWLMVVDLIGRTGRTLAGLVAAARAAFPSSGEINFRVADAAAVMARIEAALSAEALVVDRLDGLSLEFADWRMNLRRSNTEPLLRLNVETRGDAAGLPDRVAALRALIDASAGDPAPDPAAAAGAAARLP